jgi:hypothetical protein
MIFEGPRGNQHKPGWAWYYVIRRPQRLPDGSLRPCYFSSPNDTKMQDFEFVLEVDGKAYRCESKVGGKHIIRQTIRVEGLGRKPDPKPYGIASHHPVSTMRPNARLVALEIINEGLPSS